ncbi:MAG: phosphoglycerate kinase, partial [Jannaschia sp.]
ATTHALARKLPACAGRQMEAELTALEAALGTPKPPVAAVVGGAKVSSKLDLLGNLVTKVQHLIIGGGMANTFLAAKGVNVQKSLCEHDLLDTARAIIAKAEAAGCAILLPRDVVCASEFRADPPTVTVASESVPEGMMILDAGPDSVAHIKTVLDGCATLIWNGPLGAFEMTPFDAATNAAAAHAATLTKAGKLISVAGGGDTVAALNQAGAAQDFTYISTAGGAFLEWMEGKELPGVAALSA